MVGSVKSICECHCFDGTVLELDPDTHAVLESAAPTGPDADRLEEFKAFFDPILKGVNDDPNLTAGQRIRKLDALLKLRDDTAKQLEKLIGPEARSTGLPVDNPPHNSGGPTAIESFARRRGVTESSPTQRDFVRRLRSPVRIGK